MENVLLVVHIVACIGLIGVVLMQRSEGGALGIGGGGGGGLMSGRGAASVLTRITMGLAAVFFLTSLTLTTIATRSNDTDSSVTDTIKDDGTPKVDVSDDLGLFDEVGKLPDTTETPTPEATVTPDIALTPTPVPTPTPTSSSDGNQ